MSVPSPKSRTDALIVAPSWPFLPLVFLGEWLSSRIPILLLPAAISVTTGGLIAAVVAHAWSQPVDGLIGRYREATIAAVRADELTNAELYLNKLISLGAREPELHFAFALAVDKSGDVERAQRLVQRIARDSRPPFAPAHIWLAQKIGNSENREAVETRQAMRHHLSVVLEADPDHVIARRMSTELCLAEGDLAGAIRNLSQIAKGVPEERLRLAKMLSRGGDPAQARGQAELLVRDCERRLERNADDHQARLLHGQALTLLQRWTDAERVLRLGLGSPLDAPFRLALAELYCELSDATKRSSTGRLTTLDALTAAYELAPESPIVLMHLAELAMQTTQLPERLQAPAIAYLEKRHAQSPDDLALVRALARAQMLAGRTDEALLLLEPRAEGDPVLRLQRAEIYTRQGKRELATREAQAAADALHERLEKQPEAEEYALGYAEALSYLEQWDEAERVLLERQATQDNATLRFALANLYLRRSLQLPPDRAAERAEWLLKGVELAPHHEAILLPLMQHARPSSAESSRVRVKLQEILAQGKAPPLVHLVLGTSAAMDEAWPTAVTHLELAQRALPRDPALANNLAWALLQVGNDQNARRALKLVDEALERMPRNAELLETRGLARLKLREFHEAIVDLEAALIQFPQRRRLHTALAEAYQGAGQPETAEHHRRFAKE